MTLSRSNFFLHRTWSSGSCVSWLHGSIWLVFELDLGNRLLYHRAKSRDNRSTLWKVRARTHTHKPSDIQTDTQTFFRPCIEYRKPRFARKNKLYAPCGRAVILAKVFHTICDFLCKKFFFVFCPNSVQFPVFNLRAKPYVNGSKKGEKNPLSFALQVERPTVALSGSKFFSYRHKWEHPAPVSPDAVD